MATFFPSWSVWRRVLALGMVLAGIGAAQAQETVRLQERFSPDYQYHVSTRVQLAGRLALPPEKDRTPPPLAIKGTSAIEYDERVLVVRRDGQVDKTVRIYRRMDFERRVGEQLQKNALREEVPGWWSCGKTTSRCRFARKDRSPGARSTWCVPTCSPPPWPACYRAGR